MLSDQNCFLLASKQTTLRALPTSLFPPARPGGLNRGLRIASVERGALRGVRGPLAAAGMGVTPGR